MAVGYERIKRTSGSLANTLMANDETAEDWLTPLLTNECVVGFPYRICQDRLFVDVVVVKAAST